MGIVLVILLLVGLGLLVLVSWCVAGRQSTWRQSASCLCGYDVESLVGSTIDSPLLNGEKRCPECGRALVRDSVRVKGQTQIKYPPKLVAVGVVGLVWLVVGLAAWGLLAILAMPTRQHEASATTWHSLSDQTVRIDWNIKQTWRDRTGVVSNEVSATIAFERGATVSMQLAAADHVSGYPGWTRGTFRDAEGVEVALGLRDSPRQLESWLKQLSGVTNFADVATIVTVLRESMYGLRIDSVPGAYAQAKPMQVTSRRTRVTHHWSYITVCVGVAALWLVVTGVSLHALWKRPRIRVSYESV